MRKAGELEYDAARRRAFALALDGRTEAALAQLNDGWSDEWPNPAAYAADVARVRYLAGDVELALVALELVAHRARHQDADVVELACACVRRVPRLWPHAMRVALAGGTASERARAGVAVVRARRARS